MKILVLVMILVAGLAIGSYFWRSAKNENLGRDQPQNAKVHPKDDARELIDIECPDEFELELSKLGLANGFIHQPRGAVILNELAVKWFEESTRYALSMIGAIPDHESRYYALLAGKKEFVVDSEEILDFADVKLTPADYRDIRTQIFVALGKSNPKKGLELVEKFGVGERRETAIRRLFSSWSKTDLGDSLAHIQKLEFDEDKAAAYGSLANSGAEYTAADLEMIGKTEADRSVIETIGEKIVSRIASGKGVDGILESFTDHPELAQYGAAAVEMIGGRDWKDFRENLQEYQDIGLVDLTRDAGVIGKGLARNAPETAVDFIKSIEDPKVKIDAAGAVSEEWMTFKKYHDRIRDFAEELPSGELRDAVLKPMIDALRASGRNDEVAEVKKLLSK